MPLKISSRARKRYESLTSESKKDYLRRYRRLRREGRLPEVSAELAAGYLPEKLEKYPPKLRYMLHDRVKKHNLMPGTQAHLEAQQAEILLLQSWLSGWFERNHTMEFVDADE
jgi:hypothetical protein